MQQLERSCSSKRKSTGTGIICKVAFHTVGRYGKAALLMLCVGFLFLITTATSYGVLRQELDTPYVLTGTVTRQADLEKYLEVPSVEAVTPVLSFESKLTSKDTALSGTVTAVLADYLELSFTQGSVFPDDSRRVNLYYFGGYTFEQIALLENCTKRAVKRSVDLAVDTLRKNLKNFSD